MILKGAVGIAKDIKKYSESLFGEISRVAAHLELAYHQVRAILSLCIRPAIHSLIHLVDCERIAEEISVSFSPAGRSYFVC